MAEPWLAAPLLILCYHKKVMPTLKSHMPPLWFLIPLQIILTSVHLLLAAILVTEWQKATDHPFIAYGVAVALSFLFLTANIAVRTMITASSRLYYRFSMVMFGIIYVLFGGAIGATLLLTGARLFDRLEVSTLLLLQFFVPAVIAALGFVFTTHVRVKRVSLPLKGLPGNWEGKKIAFFSDAHFGPVYGVQAAKNLVKLLKRENPDVVFIGGDFYDGPPMDFKSIGREFAEVNPPLGKFIVAGNHDEYANITEARKGFHAAGFVEVDGQTEELDGVLVTGIEHTHNEEDEVKMLKEARETGKPFIVLRHEPLNVAWTAGAGAMLMLSGHTHHGQLFPLSIFTRMRYGKFTYGLHKVGDMQMFTSSGVGSWGPPLRIGTSRELVIFTCKKK